MKHDGIFLSPEEIKALLRNNDQQAAPSSEGGRVGQSQSVKVFEFARIGDSEDQALFELVNRVGLIFSDFSSELLSNHLCTKASVSLSDSSIDKLAESVTRLQKFGELQEYQDKKSGSCIWLGLDPAAHYNFMDAIYGGTGKMPAHVPRRRHTAMDRRLIDSIISHLSNSLAKTWNQCLGSDFQYQKNINNRLKNKINSSKEEVAVCRFVVRVGQGQGELLLVFPRNMLQRMQQSKDTQLRMDIVGSWRESWRNKLLSVEVDLVGYLPQIQLPLSKILTMKQGDTVPLVAPHLLCLLVENCQLLNGSYDCNGSSTAVSISDWLAK